MSRILHNHTTRARLVVPLAPLAMSASAGTLAAFLVIAVVACGSSSPSAATVLGTEVQQDCTAIADVLADGPDPGADPVGYAQAQIRPLRQLTIADAALHDDVLALASAYKGFSASGGARDTAAARQVTKAENVVNSICPQAAP